MCPHCVYSGFEIARYLAPYVGIIGILKTWILIKFKTIGRAA